MSLAPFCTQRNWGREQWRKFASKLTLSHIITEPLSSDHVREPPWGLHSVKNPQSWDWENLQSAGDLVAWGDLYWSHTYVYYLSTATCLWLSSLCSFPPSLNLPWLSSTISFFLLESKKTLLSPTRARHLILCFWVLLSPSVWAATRQP